MAHDADVMVYSEEDSGSGFESDGVTRVQDEKSDTTSVISAESLRGAIDTISQRLFHSDHLDRKLERPQITGIAFSGTIGIGLFVTSGELIGLSGSLGCVLGFIGAGFIVIGVMRSLAELVSVRPLSGALIDYPHTFVDPALGFAVGIIYCLAQCMSMAILTAAAARVAGNFNPYSPLKEKQTAGILIGLVILTLLSNACGVRMYGQIERICKWIKFFVLTSVCVLMVVVNLGVGGYPTENKSRNYTENSFVPFFKPDGFNSTHFPKRLESSYGVPGGSGVFLCVWTSITLAVFACMGGDIVIVSAGEAKKPRQDLPAAARFMYLGPLFFYILGSFLVGFNINYADPALYHPYLVPKGKFTPSHSPFIITLQRTTLAPNILPNILNAFFLFAAYTAANTALYVSSRTLFAISQKYGNKFLRQTLGKTNDGHTPLAAILVCSLFGLLSFLGLVDDTFNQPILSLSSFFTGSIGSVYASECIAYLRFKSGLNKLAAEGILGRNDYIYKRKHYRAHWQPAWAYIGLIGSVLIVVFTGWPAVYILCARSQLANRKDLKPIHACAWDIVGAYCGPLLFLMLYGGYKFVKRGRPEGQMRTFEQYRDAYVLPEFDGDMDGEKVEGMDTTSTGCFRKGSSARLWLLEVWSFIR